jgi:hypothetical protein
MKYLWWRHVNPVQVAFMWRHGPSHHSEGPSEAFPVSCAVNLSCLKHLVADLVQHHQQQHRQQGGAPVRRRRNRGGGRERDQAKAYPVAKDSYLLVDDDEVVKLQIKGHAINIQEIRAPWRDLCSTTMLPTASRRASTWSKRLSPLSGTPCATRKSSAQTGSRSRPELEPLVKEILGMALRLCSHANVEIQKHATGTSEAASVRPDRCDTLAVHCRGKAKTAPLR